MAQLGLLGVWRWLIRKMFFRAEIAMMDATMLPETFHAARLILRPIVPEDAGPIFDGYAQDATVTRFVIWRPHQSRSDTEAYIAECIATPTDRSRTYVLTDRTAGAVLALSHCAKPLHTRLDCS